MIQLYTLVASYVYIEYIHNVAQAADTPFDLSHAPLTKLSTHALEEHTHAHSSYMNMFLTARKQSLPAACGWLCKLN